VRRASAAESGDADQQPAQTEDRLDCRESGKCRSPSANDAVTSEATMPRWQAQRTPAKPARTVSNGAMNGRAITKTLRMLVSGPSHHGAMPAMRHACQMAPKPPSTPTHPAMKAIRHPGDSCPGGAAEAPTDRSRAAGDRPRRGHPPRMWHPAAVSGSLIPAAGWSPSRRSVVVHRGELPSCAPVPCARMGQPEFAKLSIFFPMWNEEEYIERAVNAGQGACEHLVATGIIADYELIIVDDASTDRTPEIADQLVAADHHIRVVHHPVNRKLGGSIKTGFASATGDLVLYTDADLPFDFAELDKALRIMRLYESDIVSAYRHDRTEEGSSRAIYTFFYNLLIRIMFGSRCATSTSRSNCASAASSITSSCRARGRSSMPSWSSGQEARLHRHPVRCRLLPTYPGRVHPEQSGDHPQDPPRNARAAQRTAEDHPGGVTPDATIWGHDAPHRPMVARNRPCRRLPLGASW